MNRRSFLAATASATAAAAGFRELTAADSPPTAKIVPQGKPATSMLAGRPVVSGPAPEALTVLQPLAGTATGFLEYRIDDGSFQRVDAERDGLQPFEQYVLKFRLPPLPPGRVVHYRVAVRPVTWVPVEQWVHGKVVAGEPEIGAEWSFRTLDPAQPETRFVVWNDTHENIATLKALADLTLPRRPDFLLWNGDQTNDVHFEKDISGQVLTPAGVELASAWPLAYVRGNHDVRGPAARKLPGFTGTPDDQFYYAFRSGPLAALVMDTGEDKPDDHPAFAGLAAFDRLKERQAKWLAGIVQQPWFREAKFRVLFCHIPLWWSKDRKDIDYWEYNKVCREAWAPTLTAAGVKVVISGHTHDYAWLPATAKRPLGQLIGGGPRPQIATLIEGVATQERLTLTMQKLDGTVVQKLEFRA